MQPTLNGNEPNYHFPPIASNISQNVSLMPKNSPRFCTEIDYNPRITSQITSSSHNNQALYPSSAEVLSQNLQLFYFFALL